MSNKIALVTGGSRGLGRDMSLRLAEKGFDVVITYHSQKQSADDVVKELESKGLKSAAIQFDSSKISSLDGFVQQFQSTLKEKFNADKFDALINNAGMGANIPFLKATEKDFDEFLNVHYKSVYFLTQKLVPLMNDGGSIINISSGTTRYSFPGYSLYAPMKGAIEVLSRYMAKELGDKKIRVNVVAPGAIETDFNNAAFRNNEERKKMTAAQTALGRTGKPEDIGGVVAFLCSDDAAWINGQRIEVSGGINL